MKCRLLNFFYIIFKNNLLSLSVFIEESTWIFLGWLVGWLWDYSQSSEKTGSTDKVPSMAVLLRDPRAYLWGFEENHRKLRTARSTSMTGDLTCTSCLPVSRVLILGSWWVNLEGEAGLNIIFKTKVDLNDFD